MEKKDIMPVGELIEAYGTIASDMEYDLKKARSPKSKRGIKSNIKFCKSTLHHLTELQKLQNEANKQV